MPDITDDNLEEYIEKNSRTPPYPTLEDFKDYFDINNKKTPSKYADKLVTDGKVVRITEDGKDNKYCHVTNYGNIDEEIEKAVDKAKNLLADARSPTLEEIANIAGFDEEDATFRENYHKLKRDRDFSEPAEDIREEKNSEVLNIVVQSILRDRGIGDREKIPEHLISEKVDEYIRNNEEILEDTKVHEAGLEPNGKPDSVTIEFPEELQILLDRSQERVSLE